MDQLNEQWSMTTLRAGFDSVPPISSESRLSGSGPFGSSPVRTRMCWMSTSDVVIRMPAPRIMMPGEGAVWPAMRSCELRMMRSEVNLITPDTSNTQVRGPLASMQALSEPEPLAFTLVTL